MHRLFNVVENAIIIAIRKLVFEPNSQSTWHRAKAVVDSYLHNLWQRGALVDNRHDEAWFSQIDEDITMADDDIKQGRMIVKIGLATVRSAEFIMLQLTQDFEM